MRRAATVLTAAAVAVYGAAWASFDGVPRPKHEAGLRAALLTELGAVSATGRGISALELQARALSSRAPLDATPFLIAGGIADQLGDAARASRLYGAALRRDPRSIGAHYMLARHALAKADADLALRHSASIARQSPGAGPEFSTMMKAVASDRSLDRSLRRFLAREPDSRDALFNAMAADPALTGRLIELARATKPNRPPWLAKLVETELNAGREDRAASAWVDFGGGDDPRKDTVRDPHFTLLSSAPPFSWSILPSDSGAAAASDRGLDVETYGRSPQPLLSQTLLLGPGRYHLRSSVSGDVAPQLEWRLRCFAGDRPIAILPVGRNGVLVVPDACRAQLLGLWTNDGEDGLAASGKLLSIELERRP